MLRPSVSTPTVSAGAPDPVAVTHGCVRCGAPVPIDIALCERCNPLGLAQPSASQVHGTAVAGVMLAVVLLAVFARIGLSGIGPFTANVAATARAADGLAVTITVKNEGTKAGSTSCRVTDPEQRFTGPSVYLLSPQVPPGTSLTFTGTVTTFGTDPKPLDVNCATP